MDIVKLVIMRHGESSWNQENQFSGWFDVPLSQKGEKDAIQAGRTLAEQGFDFDEVHTSVLSRAIKNAWLVMEEMHLLWLPEYKTFRLNERMYGALQGQNRKDAAKEYGEAQVKIWRRSFAVPPPPMDPNNKMFPGRDRRYNSLPRELIPLTESLKDTMSRFLVYWNEAILPAMKNGKRLFISTHGSIIRALMKHLDNLSDEEIVEVNIPNAIPLVYEFDASTMKPLRHYWLADEETVTQEAKKIADMIKTE